MEVAHGLHRMHQAVNRYQYQHLETQASTDELTLEFHVQLQVMMKPKSSDHHHHHCGDNLSAMRGRLGGEMYRLHSCQRIWSLWIKITSGWTRKNKFSTSVSKIFIRDVQINEPEWNPHIFSAAEFQWLRTMLLRFMATCKLERSKGRRHVFHRPVKYAHTHVKRRVSSYHIAHFQSRVFW